MPEWGGCVVGGVDNIRDRKNGGMTEVSRRVASLFI